MPRLKAVRFLAFPSCIFLENISKRFYIALSSALENKGNWKNLFLKILVFWKKYIYIKMDLYIISLIII